MYDRAGFEFDLVTQRFLRARWETPPGKEVLERIAKGNGSSIRGILDPYVLKHPESLDPYGHPYYPPDAMEGHDTFWVLTQDDLRGARFIREDFAGGNGFAKKSLSYCWFAHCNFKDANLEGTQLTKANFEDCDLTSVSLAYADGFDTKFQRCSMRDACMVGGGFIETDFSGSDLRKAYWEDAVLEDLKVDYRTLFDENLTCEWGSRKLPDAQRPDILRRIRRAFAAEEIWDVADRFFYRERVERRRHLIAPRIKGQPLLALRWLGDWISGAVAGYGTKPARIVVAALVLSLAFAWAYLTLGVPEPARDGADQLLQALYLSLTTFATLGYGDVTYPATRPWPRLLTTAEGWAGGIMLALFVAALARKAFR